MEKLKDNDIKLLGFCNDQRKSVNEIAQFLKIKPSSVSAKIRNLEKKRLILINKQSRGKKTFVRTLEGDKTTKYFIILLKELKKRGGLTIEEFSAILPFNPYDLKEADKLKATMTLEYQQPKLIEKKIFITPEGEKFLKENSKKK